MRLLPEDIIALKKRSREETFEYIFFWKAELGTDGSLGTGS